MLLSEQNIPRQRYLEHLRARAAWFRQLRRRRAVNQNAPVQKQRSAK